MKSQIQIAFSLLLASLAVGSSQQLMFNNPIFEGNSADPCILKFGVNYYLTLMENGGKELVIYKSPIMTNFRNRERKVAYSTVESRAMWASEMHEVDGELFIYFTMEDPQKGDVHRMYVIKGDNSSDPMGSWGQPIQLETPYTPGQPTGSIDGTVMRHNGQLYFLWTDDVPQGLAIFISPMLNGTVLQGPTILLREPLEPWECNDGCINEGPFFIYNRNVSYMVFSGSGTFDPNYSLTWMSIEDEKNPMNVSNWRSAPGPVFSRMDDEGVYTTGHAAFTVSPDGTETWMVYHASDSPVREEIIGARIARLERVDFHQLAGVPLFPRPHGYSHAMRVPSGQTEV